MKRSFIYSVLLCLAFLHLLAACSDAPEPRYYCPDDRVKMVKEFVEECDEDNQLNYCSNHAKELFCTGPPLEQLPHTGYRSKEK